ncbi:MAG TPA: DUF167 domain-containing protein [Candidatus Limnocylindria bacterium]
MASLAVLVTPRAAADRVGPVEGGVLRVRVTRPPADGEANRAVQRLVARALELPPGSLRLVSGERSRHKRFAIDALSARELAARLARIDEPAD